MVRSLLGVVTLLLFGGAAACSEPRTGYDAQQNNPLGPSFWIVPTPSDDDSLLSRSFAAPPDTALTLEEQSTPNPCADQLALRRQAQMPNHFENAISTRDTAQTGALLAMYGFAANAKAESSLLYKVSTSTKVTRLDTNEYVACCREHDCGWGYVQSLVFGEGEYAAGSEVKADADANYSVINGGATHWFKVANSRAIKGYLAAVIVAHDRRQAVRACAADMVWAKLECVPKAALAQAEMTCAHGAPQAKDAFWADNPSMQDLFEQQQAYACSWLTLHGRPAAPVAGAAAAEPTP